MIFLWLRKVDIIYLVSKIWVSPVKLEITASSEWTIDYAPENILTQDGYWAAAKGEKVGWLKISFSSLSHVGKPNNSTSSRFITC